MTEKEALAALVALLGDPAQGLRLLGSAPLAIASASNKFNDAWEDDYWCAVHLGQYRWEQSQFFGSSNADGFGLVKESGSTRLARDDYGSAEASASDLAAARAILKRLDRAGWHDLAQTAIRLPSFGGILALVVQFDQVWLHCSDPRGGADDQIFALVGNELLHLARVDQRFDDMASNAELIHCDEPDPEVVARLSPEARMHFDDRIHDQPAAVELGELLVGVALKLDDLTHEIGPDVTPVAARLDVNLRDARYQWDKRISASRSLCWPRFALGEKYFDRNYFNILRGCADRLPKAAARLEERAGLPFDEVEQFLRDQDRTAVRRLFDRATGIDTFDTEELFLLSIGPVPYLLFRSKLYRASKRGIELVRNWRGSDSDLTESVRDWIADLPSIFRQQFERHG